MTDAGTMDQDEKTTTRMSFFGLMLRLWPFIKGQPRRLILCVALILTYVSTGRSLPLIFGYMIDEGFKKNNLTLIFALAGAYLVLDVLRGLFAYLQNSYILKFGNQILYNVRETLTLHMQRLPMSYFDKNSSGRIMTRVTTDIANLGDLFTDGFTAFFVSVIEMVSIVAAMCVLSWKLTALSLSVIPFLAIATSWITLRIRERFGLAKKRLAALNASAAETLSGLRVVHLFDGRQNRMAKFTRLSAEYKHLQLETVKLFAALWPTVEAFQVTTIITALLCGALYYESFGLSFGSLAAFVLLIQSFFHPVRVILERYNQLQNSLASADRVFDVLNAPTEPGAEETRPATKLTGDIAYQSVSFQYDTTAPLALNDVNLHIKAGESVAFVGRTGSGKTTMISLLQKFYPITSGRILIDGKDLKSFAPEELRSRFGVVLQDPFLFRGTLRENVALHRDDFSDERILRALSDVGLQSLLGRNAGIGLEFFIEERGANLSAGERQLVAFARLLAFDPDVLILDEATSNIDSISEQRIQAAIASVTRGRTSLIIAHRLSTIVGCDKIVLMENGRICEVGRHGELLARGGKYAELYRSQTQSSLSIPLEAFSDL